LKLPNRGSYPTITGPVELVEKLETKPFRAESPRGEDHFAFTFANELFQQAGYVAGVIFAVGRQC
jgi:hypothetical protein